MEEHLTLNQGVQGSSPWRCTEGVLVLQPGCGVGASFCTAEHIDLSSIYCYDNFKLIKKTRAFHPYRVERRFAFKGADYMAAFDRVKSGIPEMDEALDNIRLGDNVVWRVSELSQFKLFMEPYVKQAIEDRRNIIYFRFASHEPLLEDCPGVR